VPKKKDKMLLPIEYRNKGFNLKFFSPILLCFSKAYCVSDGDDATIRHPHLPRLTGILSNSINYVDLLNPILRLIPIVLQTSRFILFIGIRCGVSKGVEDGRRPLALQAGHS
jgi:hypothetical protein